MFPSNPYLQRCLTILGKDGHVHTTSCLFLLVLIDNPLEGRSRTLNVMKITTLKKTPNGNDRLIEGYSVTLDGQLFNIFVMEELTGTKRGYILKLMLGLGDSTTVDLHRQKALYPQATELMRRHLPDAWVNKGKTPRCYRYIVFGHGEQNKQLALNLLRVLCDELDSKKVGRR